MRIKDFEGIEKFKKAILFLVAALILFNIIGPLYYYESYLQAYLVVQSFFICKFVFYVAMTFLATREALSILTRKEKGPLCLQDRPELLHVIVLPIYLEEMTILKNTLKYLASHTHAHKNYIVFLAFEEKSINPKENAMELLKTFGASFRQMHYTIHKLQEGQAKGKSSNVNCAVQAMKPFFDQKGIDPSTVMFTTFDCDNWVPEVYFEEVELHLSKRAWNMDNLMFGPGQMFNINSRDTPLLCRHADYLLGAGIFAWSNTLTQVQNVASNYSLSYNTLQKMGYYDTNDDAMCDDYHMSSKAMWKTNGDLHIIPIHVMVNLVSVQTGKGYLEDISARFWQAERHMRSMLDAAYNFNMLVKSPFHWRTLWFSLSYFENHFVPMGLYLSALTLLIVKLLTGKDISEGEMWILRAETLLVFAMVMMYHLVIRKSARVLYSQQEPSWTMVLQQLFLNKLIMLLFVSLPELIATIRIGTMRVTYESAQKIFTASDKNKQD